MSGCALTGGTLGGREKCWPEDDSGPRACGAGSFGSTLGRPPRHARGRRDPARPGRAHVPRHRTGGELLRGADVVANGGDDVSLFGGAGADGFLVMCAVEENRSGS